MKLLFIACFIFISFTAAADYLIVTRTGNLREEPSVQSSILEKVTVGDTLLLLEAVQSAGYYHVVTTVSGREGWIYRTLVRKVSGDVGSIPPENLNAVTVAEVRVLDVGAGLCTLVKLPNDKYLMYDAGGDFNTNGERTITQIKEYIPAGSQIELLVLSHTDADHIIAASQVLRDYVVKKVLWSGFEGSMISGNPTAAYQRLVAALNNHHAVVNVNLNEEDSVITPGHSFTIGAAKFTFLCGFGKPLDEWNLTDRGEMINSVSIVMKMDFGGKSVLFCGDAVGRHRNDDENALIATEKFMVESAAAHLPSTVLIAPHHGARNGSSTAFVNLVAPQKVIFSAGHKFLHPTTRTANLYLQNLTTADLFRTDRGDDEGTGEWTFGKLNGCSDKYNDDTIQIQLRSNGTFRVFYIEPDNTCAP